MFGEDFALEFSDVAVAHAIQLAVAPVFLLTGIAAILTVMTNRLGRVIDRARVLEERLERASQESLTTLRADLAVLSRRAKLNGRAITLCTTTALLVCTVIAVLFLSAFLRFDAALPVALLFVAAMLCFFLGLLWFLREIYLATMTVRIGPH
jgi:predicted signal transduction protein with EAL and GGDEF domain